MVGERGLVWGLGCVGGCWGVDKLEARQLAHGGARLSHLGALGLHADEKESSYIKLK